MVSSAKEVECKVKRLYFYSKIFAHSFLFACFFCSLPQADDAATRHAYKSALSPNDAISCYKDFASINYILPIYLVPTINGSNIFERHTINNQAVHYIRCSIVNR